MTELARDRVPPCPTGAAAEPGAPPGCCRRAAGRRSAPRSSGRGAGLRPPIRAAVRRVRDVPRVCVVRGRVRLGAKRRQSRVFGRLRRMFSTSAFASSCRSSKSILACKKSLGGGGSAAHIEWVSSVALPSSSRPTRCRPNARCTLRVLAKAEGEPSQSPVPERSPIDVAGHSLQVPPGLVADHALAGTHMAQAVDEQDLVTAKPPEEVSGRNPIRFETLEYPWQEHQVAQPGMDVRSTRVQNVGESGDNRSQTQNIERRGLLECLQEPRYPDQPQRRRNRANRAKRRASRQSSEPHWRCRHYGCGTADH